MSVTYKTKDGTQIGFVPGVGQIVDGSITVPDGVLIENANLVKVDDQPQPALVAPAPSPSVGIPQLDPQTPKQIPMQSNQENE